MSTNHCKEPTIVRVQEQIPRPLCAWLIFDKAFDRSSWGKVLAFVTHSEFNNNTRLSHRQDGHDGENIVKIKTLREYLDRQVKGK